MKTKGLVINRTLAENYSRKFSSFLEDHSTNLRQIIEGQGHSLVINGSFQCSSKTDDPIRIHPFSTKLSLNEDSLLVSINENEDQYGSQWNPDVEKAIFILSNLASQLRLLTNEGWKEFPNQLILYGDNQSKGNIPNSSSILPLSDRDDEDEFDSEGNGYCTLSTALPLFFRLKDFLGDVKLLLDHAVSQLEVCYKGSRPYVINLENVHLTAFINELCSLFVLIVVIDEIFDNHSILNQHWSNYKRMIHSVGVDSAAFDIEISTLEELQKDIDELDEILFCSSGASNNGIFRQCLVALNQRHKKSNNQLLSELLYQLQRMECNLENSFLSGEEPFGPIAYSTLFVFACSICNFEGVKKYFRNHVAGTLLKKIVAVPIGGNWLWFPGKWLNSLQSIVINDTNDPLIDRKLLEGQVSFRHSFLEERIRQLPLALAKNQLEVHSWTIKCHVLYYGKTRGAIRREDLSKSSVLLLDGLKLAAKLQLSFKLLMNLHGTLGRPIRPVTLSCLIKHLELLKLVENTINRYNTQISQIVLILTESVVQILLGNIKQLKESIKNRQSSNYEDVCTLICLMERIFYIDGIPSKTQLIFGQIIYDWLSIRISNTNDNEEKMKVINAALTRINDMLGLQERFQEYISTSSFYFHRHLLIPYINALPSSTLSEVNKLPILAQILEDLREFYANHSTSPSAIESEDIKFDIDSYFNEHIILKLCRDVENDLRLQAHSHLQLKNEPLELSPFSNDGLKTDLQPYFQLESLLNGNYKVNIKNTVEHHLSRNFYNLASVSLHNWQTYTSMRILGKEKYNLNILDDYLPSHSLEQGQDILRILRNLKQFVLEWSYNLNNQVFIQTMSSNKHLETLSIRHIANSFRTHGLGLSNIIINTAYQFLRQKIHSFSQFLCFEQIRSKLTKDIRNLKTTSTSTSIVYPYDKAVKFQKGIKKLSSASNNVSPLDQFRIIITQIGNTLGLVRLVVSGGRHHISQGSRFLLPNSCEDNESLDSEGAFLWKDKIQETFSNDSFVKEKCGILLDEAIQCLKGKKLPSTHYFHLLVSTFQAPLLQSANNHMKNFYAIIPPLTLSYVEHLKNAKEKLLKKSSKTSLQFTDDGFAMGIAYLLKVLDQDDDFDGLGWFGEVTKHLIKERQEALRVINEESRSDEKLKQAFNLTAKRVQDSLHEFHLLKYNLSSARIFFQQQNPN